MPTTDRYGLPLSTPSPAAAEHYVQGVDRLLAYRFGADQAFAAAVAADEGFALGHAGLALFASFQGDSAAAQERITRAGTLVAGASPREQRHVAALAAFITGETARGLALTREHLAACPRDALLANQAASAIYFSGGQDRDEARMAFLEDLIPAYGDDWWFLSALGFSYHENRRFSESRRLSERSLQQEPRNASGSHNIAHVLFETVENAEGVAFLENWLGGYDRRAPYHCHLSWHLALFELHAGRYARALAIYEQDILGASNPRLTLIDGAALLWRCQIYRATDRPLAWTPLRQLAGRVSRPGFIFGDMHAALVYAATGDTAALAGLLDALHDLDAKGHPTAGSIAVPLVRAALAFAEADYDGVIRHIVPLDGQLHRIGGSHAQWELFEEMLVEACLRTERYEDAIALLRRRLDRRSSPRDLFWLGRAQVGLGAAGAGGASLRAARRLWSTADPNAPEQARLHALIAKASA